MFNFINNFHSEFNKQTIANKLIYINVLSFIATSIFAVIAFIFELENYNIFNKFSLSANLAIVIKQPWSFITYMFLHNGIFHLLFNMLWLYFGGKLFLSHLQPKQFLSTYILGGLFGGISFIAAYNYLPVFQDLSYDAYAVGASASVFAIIVAIATYVPNYTVNVPFLNNVKLKYIAIFMVLIDIFSIPKGNSGGHIAHLGGALFGYIYIKQINKGKDVSIYKIVDMFLYTFKKKNNLKKTKKRTKSDYEFNAEYVKKQRGIDKILEKISTSGYESLSKEEKKILFSASKNK